ncbi:MAG: hypothetical protein HFJ09_06715, partial [Lachnospiraceae bacterium]|nr:hypothetical protein [Lachnospiraceae bacterium]
MLETTKKYIEQGLFKNYSNEHIFAQYLQGKTHPFSINNSTNFSNGTYISFMFNFERNLHYIGTNLDNICLKTIFGEYLACKENYTDEKFYIRYNNVIIFCGLFSILNKPNFSWHVDIEDDNLSFACEDREGNITLFTTMLWKSRDINCITDYVSLYFGLKKETQQKIKKLFKEENVQFYSLSLKQLIENTKSRFNQQDTQYISIIQAENWEAFYEIEGGLLNEYTGLYITDQLHTEYDCEDLCKYIEGTLVYKPNLEYILLGDYRFLFSERNSYFLYNRFQKRKNFEQIKKIIYPFPVKFKKEKCTYRINVSDEKKEFITNILNFYMTKSINKMKYSNTFKGQIIKSIIENYLNKYPELLYCFQLDKKNTIEKIYNEYLGMLSVFSKKYPQGHVLCKDTIIMDAVGFTLAYCMYVVPHFLHNKYMMKDLLEKKLVCKKKSGEFDLKLYNEAYSEMEIFLYLFFGIFIKSDLHKNFVRLEYEPDGNANKKFEYSFVFSDFKINIEVKALECAPELTDNIDLFKIKHGELFYKYYFPGNEENNIPKDILKQGTELKSNYRQLNKNIKRIKRKCQGKVSEINLGFIMINYGTSREEFISYLMHPQYGYMRKNKLDNVDAIILFSMCTITDLYMDNILDYEHIIVLVNQDKNNKKLFQKLRLN